MAPNPNTRWRSTTRFRQPASGAQPQYAWRSERQIFTGPYLAIAFWCTTLIENGAPGWLHLVVLLCIWNALKMMAIGPVSVVLLVRARAREYRAQRQELAPLGELTRSSR